MKTKQELYTEIEQQLATTRKAISTTWSSQESDATNRLALATLYLALTKLV